MTHKLIAVEFVDARTGAVFARSEVPIEQLPASFEAATTLNIGEQEWEVVGAEPATAEAFAETGALTLTLSRIEYVSPQNLLLTLPTICDHLPDLEPAEGGAEGPVFRLYEDDWRQIELVSRAFAADVEAELRAIRTIYETSSVPASGFTAFRDLHVRRLIPSPLGPGLSLEEITSRLPASSRALRCVGPLGSTALVRGGFAFELAECVLYGLRANGQIAVLGLHRTGSDQTDRAGETAGFLADVMTTEALLLVDWCRCLVLEPDTDAIAGYLAE